MHSFIVGIDILPAAIFVCFWLPTLPTLALFALKHSALFVPRSRTKLNVTFVRSRNTPPELDV